jgi:hypothetical protein
VHYYESKSGIVDRENNAMAFWIRELAGWAMVLAGLYLFAICLGLLNDRRVIEAGIGAGIGVIVFRGGIHLIKVATAARVVLAARRQAAPRADR